MEQLSSETNKVAYNAELGEAIVTQALASVPKDSHIYVRKAVDLADRIRAIMKRKKIKPSKLAESTGKSKAEVSRWLSGTHNFTIRTLAKIEAVLDEDAWAVTSDTSTELVIHVWQVGAGVPAMHPEHMAFRNAVTIQQGLASFQTINPYGPLPREKEEQFQEAYLCN